MRFGLFSIIWIVEEAPRKRRQRQRRVPDNPMALAAYRVMVAAEKVFKTTNALAAGMESHLHVPVRGGQIQQYLYEEPEKRNVPPGDVLLAAAQAAGISVDRELGVVHEPTEVERMRAEMTELREEVAQIRAEMAARSDAPADQSATVDDLTAARAEREAQRQAWAEQSQPAPA